MTADHRHASSARPPVSEPVGDAPEEIHVVPPSWQPILLAIGLTLVLAGIVVSPILWIVGIVLTIRAIINWLGELRRDYYAAGHGAGGPGAGHEHAP